jgi:hypothetical protein
MGGQGSTRWGWHHKRRVVESCLVLDVGRLIKHIIPGMILERQVDWEGQIVWNDAYSAHQIASIGYSIHWRRALPDLVLQYRLSQSRQIKDNLEVPSYQIRMVKTRPHYGGFRWWFTCPLIVNDCPCQRRVGKLYLPPGGQFFGCRHCYQLTYSSTQKAHSLDRRTDSLGQTLFLFEKIRRIDERINRFKRWSRRKEKLLKEYIELVDQYYTVSDAFYSDWAPQLMAETVDTESIITDLDSLLRSIEFADEEFLRGIDDETAHRVS